MARRHHNSSPLDSQSTELTSTGSGNPVPVNPAPQNNHYWYLALLFLVLIAPFLGSLGFSSGKVLGNPRCDNPSAYYYYSYFVGQCWRNGILPLWNPYIQLGLPMIGDGEASIFHPLSFLFAFLDTGLAINWIIAISFVLTGLFFYGYLRALKLGQPAAWCGAVTWSFSSAMISRIYAGHMNILLTFISIPLILMLWEKYRLRGGVWHLLGISAAYGLMILAYYPQFLYIFSLFFMFYVLIQSGLAILDHASTARREGRAILSLGAFILLGIGLGAIQLFPSIDFVSRSFRQNATIEYCGAFSFPPENILTLIAPRFFGSTLTIRPGIYWGRNLFWEMWIYLGILPLIVAVAGAWVAPRRRRAALLACTAIFLILGLGRNTFLFPAIYAHVPFFDIFRGSSKNTLIVLFCLVTLSAYGFESFFGETDEVKRRRLRLIALVSGSTILLVSAALLFLLVRTGTGAGGAWAAFSARIMRTRAVMADSAFLKDPSFLAITAAGASRALVRGMILAALSCALILLSRPARWRGGLFAAAAAFVLVDLLGVFLPMMKNFDESITRIGKGVELKEEYPYPLRILNPSTMPNVAMLCGYSSAFGYVGNTLQRYNDFISRVQGLDPRESHAMSAFQRHTPYYKMLALDAIAIDRKDAPPDAKPIGRIGERVLVPYESLQKKLPRVFLAEAPQNFTESTEALEYVFQSNADVQARPAIERKEAALPPHPLEAGEFAQFVSFQPNRVELVVHSNWPRALVLCGMYEKNWTVRVNGQRKRVFPANYVYRSVRVPAGTSRVVFKYRPLPFYWGVAVSAVSLAVLLLIGARAHLKPGLQAGPCATGADGPVELSAVRQAAQGKRRSLRGAFKYFGLEWVMR